MQGESRPGSIYEKGDCVSMHILLWRSAVEIRISLERSTDGNLSFTPFLCALLPLSMAVLRGPTLYDISSIMSHFLLLHICKLLTL